MTHHCNIGLVEGKVFLIPHGRQFVAVRCTLHTCSSNVVIFNIEPLMQLSLISCMNNFNAVLMFRCCSDIVTCYYQYIPTSLCNSWWIVDMPNGAYRFNWQNSRVGGGVMFDIRPQHQQGARSPDSPKMEKVSINLFVEYKIILISRFCLHHTKFKALRDFFCTRKMSAYIQLSFYCKLLCLKIKF